MDLKPLEQEITRYTRFMRFVKPRDIVEAMRNRWGKRLGSDYVSQIDALMKSMIERKELELSMDGRTLSRRKTRERSVGNLVFEDSRALLAGEQTVTFRSWANKVYANYYQGNIITAQDRRGKPVAIIKITQTPYKKMSDQLLVSDWINIGYDYMQRMRLRINGETPWSIWQKWINDPDYLWIIRFEVLEALNV